MAFPTITVITVVYNRVNTIEQTISSVVNQTYPYLEYIVIDGGSTDGTVDIIKKYEKQIAYWVSEKDAGIYDAMNKGVRVATGDYIEFLNSDDCFCSYNIISQVVKEIDEDTDILSCWIYVVDEKSKREWVVTNSHAVNKRQYNGGMIPHPGMFTKKRLLEKYPFDVRLKIASDYKFFLTCYYDDTIRFKYINFPVVYFSNAGISSNENFEAKEIERELGKNFGGNSAKTRLIAILRSVFGNFIYTTSRAFFWIPIRDRFRILHRCNNKICRWCGRDNNL